MRRALALCSMVAAWILVASAPAGAIVYGQFDGNQHPNVGTMVVDIDGDKFSICSGTLIAPDIFLTASHCTAFPEQVLETDRVWVSFDPVFDPVTSTLFPGTTNTHPEFGFSGPGGFSDAHDIAVIELDAPVAGITPAELPTEELLDDLKASKQLKSQTFTAVGYGTVRETRKMAWQSILDNNERRFGLQSALALRPFWLQLSMNQATGDAGTCFGDSGGPHFLGGVSSNLLVSITVTGDRWCKATDTTYRVDTDSARDFLEDFVTLP
ncbi:MAG: S1 family peptidase [Actinomycetota bacterium]